MSFEPSQDHRQEQQGVEVGGDRIAGQAQDHAAIQKSRQHRFPGLQSNAVEQNVGTELFKHLGQEVPFPHGDPPGRQQHLRGTEVLQESPNGLWVVGNRGEAADLGTQGMGQGRQHGPVGVPDLMGLGSQHQLVPGGRNPDLDALAGAQGLAYLGTEPQAGGVQRDPLRQQQISQSGLAPPAADVGSSLRFELGKQTAIDLPQLLHGHHGIGPGGQHRASHDAHAGARFHLPTGGIIPRKKSPQDSARCQPILEANGCPVHGAAIQGRIVAIRTDRALDGCRDGFCQNGQGFVKGDQGRSHECHGTRPSRFPKRNLMGNLELPSRIMGTRDPSKALDDPKAPPEFEGNMVGPS